MCLRTALLLVFYTTIAPAALGQAQQLPADQLKKIKAATVFIKMTAGPVRGTGSGFLVKVDGTTGFVASNDHVVAGPRTPLGRLQSKVELVFHSGTKDEWAAPGEVVGQDSERDLALVRFTSPKPLPDPLPLTAPDKLAETMPVYVCGFPFGEMMAAGDKHPEISIGLASVSSIRSNERNEVVTVQLNGALNPGNSGGPVVSAEGKLVGVAVRTVRGAGIGEAVPGPMVGEMLRGRVGGTRLVQTREWAAGRMAGLVGQIADPFSKVRNVRGFVAPVSGQSGVPLDVSSVAGAVKLPLRMADPSEMLVFSTVRLPNARQVWVQVEWQELGGGTRRTPAAKVDVKTMAQIAEEEEKVARFLQKLFEGKGSPPPTPEDDPTAPPSARPPDAPRAGPPPVRPGFPSPKGPPTADGPPAETLALADLLSDPAAHAGREVTVRVKAKPADPHGTGDGPSLAALDPATGRPIRTVDFVVDRDMADQLRVLPADCTMWLTGTLRDGVETRPWKVFVVRELTMKGVAAWQLERLSRRFDPPGPPDGGAFRDGERLADEGPVIADPDRFRNRPVRIRYRLASFQSFAPIDVAPRGAPPAMWAHDIRQPNGQPGRLGHYLSSGLFHQVNNAIRRIEAAGHPRPNVEFVFKVARPNGSYGEVGCAVSHVRLLDPVTGDLVWAGTALPPEDTPPNRTPTLTPKMGGAQNPIPAGTAVDADPLAPRSSTQENEANGATPSLLLLFGVLGIGASVGVGVVIFLVARAQAKAAPRRKKGRSRDWDEDDEDDDPPPRKPARRR